MTGWFLILFTAHLLGDFIFQSNKLVKLKSKLPWLLFHSAIVTAITYILIGVFAFEPVIILAVILIFLSHFIIDRVKSFWGQDGIYFFLIDQGIHITALTGIAWMIGEQNPVNRDVLWFDLWGIYYIKILIIISGLILVVKVGGVIIEKSMASIIEQVKDRIGNGLKNGGKYIGMLERVLTFMLVLVGQYGAIGFLFAAKSILRFGEIKDPEQRKEAEYIIIGTLMSFGWAVFVSEITRQVLQITS